MLQLFFGVGKRASCVRAYPLFAQLSSKASPGTSYSTTDPVHLYCRLQNTKCPPANGCRNDEKNAYDIHSAESMKHMLTTFVGAHLNPGGCSDKFSANSRLRILTTVTQTTGTHCVYVQRRSHETSTYSTCSHLSRECRPTADLPLSQA